MIIDPAGGPAETVVSRTPREGSAGPRGSAFTGARDSATGSVGWIPRE